jgi:hypothetical protein
MKLDEWRNLVEDINIDIGAIVLAQHTLDDINEQLRRRRKRPIEEDFISADAFGRDPAAPNIVSINGVEIQIRMLHRRGLRQRDIAGADLLYEILGRKFALIQYKSPNHQGRVSLDRPQLEELSEKCPNHCPPSSPGYFLTCGAWYAVRSSEASSYLPACEALRRFGSDGSKYATQFESGWTRDEFHELFGGCKIGARTRIEELTDLSREALKSDRVLIDVLQRGSFEMW